MSIVLKQMLYFSNISSLSAAESSLSPHAEQPEITGKMEALEEYLQSYKAMSELLKDYKALLNEDVRRLRNAGTEMIMAEASLIK